MTEDTSMFQNYDFAMFIALLEVVEELQNINIIYLKGGELNA